MNDVVTPAFEVHKHDGTYTVRKFRYVVDYLTDDDGEIVRDENGRKVITEKRRVVDEEERQGGWMVYLPNGASLHVATEKEMKRLGFDRAAGLVDEDGEPVAEMHHTSLKDRAERSVSPRRRGRAASA